MKRRTLLQVGGGLAAASAALATGCDNKTGKTGAAGAAATDAAGGAGGMTGTNAAAAAAGGGTKGGASRSSWTALGKSLDGKLIRASDASYATARRLYNTRYDTLKPSAIAYVEHPADIAECLAFARRHDTPVAIRSGGHSYAGWSSGNNKLIIDVSALSKVGAPSGGTTHIGSRRQAHRRLPGPRGARRDDTRGLLPHRRNIRPHPGRRPWCVLPRVRPDLRQPRRRHPGHGGRQDRRLRQEAARRPLLGAARRPATATSAWSPSSASVRIRRRAR